MASDLGDSIAHCMIFSEAQDDLSGAFFRSTGVHAYIPIARHSEPLCYYSLYGLRSQ